MTANSPAAEAELTDAEEQPAPACVMSFNVNDPSGAGGTAGDVATIAALNQADRMHPNAEGVKRIVTRLLPMVEKLLAEVPGA